MAGLWLPPCRRPKAGRLHDHLLFGIPWALMTLYVAPVLPAPTAKGTCTEDRLCHWHLSPPRRVHVPELLGRMPLVAVTNAVFPAHSELIFLEEKHGSSHIILSERQLHAALCMCNHAFAGCCVRQSGNEDTLSLWSVLLMKPPLMPRTSDRSTPLRHGPVQRASTLHCPACADRCRCLCAPCRHHADAWCGASSQGFPATQAVAAKVGPDIGGQVARCCRARYLHLR